MMVGKILAAAFLFYIAAVALTNGDYVFAVIFGILCGVAVFREV